jgi:hypothetical protein
MPRTHFRHFTPMTISGLLIVCNALAQTGPVRDWAAPLYWQPSAKEATIIKNANPMRAENVPSSGDPTAPLMFVAITPCRMMDTRGYDSTFTGVYGSPSLTAASTRTLPVAGVTAGYCGLPGTAQAVSLNVTLWPNAGTSVQWLTLWPAGQPQPAVSTLNDYQGTVFSSANGVSIYGINNAAIVPLGTGGAFNVYVTDPTNLFIDVNGYYASPTDLQANTVLGAGVLENNTTGSGNTASGSDALQSNTTGNSNTASGSDALQNNSTGNFNTASGSDALQNNTTGANNTASGYYALQSNTTGGSNTASGYYALQSNTSGSTNTANGYYALENNTTGSSNTASGVYALKNNTSGSSNTASGYYALQNNTTGYFNTASGYYALPNNTTGADNTASGYWALQSNTTGGENTASGVSALYNNTTGGSNVALGYQAGYNVTGSNNIEIGNQGTSADSGTIRIGTPGTQNSFFIAGVNGVTTTNSAVPVLIDTTNGQLGVTSSSRRYKEDIQNMGDASLGLMQLRPVTFRYKKPFADGSKPVQYGLIAEEVEEVYPDLVARSADGQIETVKYQVLDSMLLNEVQKQQRVIESQKNEFAQTIEAQKEQFTGRLQAQDDLIRQLESRLAELENRAK